MKVFFNYWYLFRNFIHYIYCGPVGWPFRDSWLLQQRYLCQYVHPRNRRRFFVQVGHETIPKFRFSKSFFSIENQWNLSKTRRPTHINEIFENFDFLKMWLIFVSSFHNVGRPDNDVIQRKNFHYMHMTFHGQLLQKILKWLVHPHHNFIAAMSGLRYVIKG